MSGLVMGLVFELPITEEFGRPEKFILLAYADHADQDGRNIFPSVDLIALKTGYKERATQLITGSLNKQGYLVPDGIGPHGTNRWRIPLVRLPNGGAKIAPQPVRGAENAPPNVSKNAPEGNAPEGIAPEPSVVVIQPSEEEEGGAAQFLLSPELQNELEQHAIYRKVWPDIDELLTAGKWTEADILAVMDWQTAVNAGKPTYIAQRIVARLREGSKAPAKYMHFMARQLDGRWYPGKPVDQDFSQDEPDAPQTSGNNPQGTVTSEIERAWSTVLEQVRADLSRSRFGPYLEQSVPISFASGCLKIQVEDNELAVWCSQRLASTAERLLIGILNQKVEVVFTAPAPDAQVA